MILTDKTILKMMENGDILIEPLPSPEQIQPASVDLRLGNEFLAPIGTNDIIDVKNTEPHYQSINGNAIVIPPKEFILATTKEKIHLPSNLIARVEGRSSIGRLGITIHVTAGFIDAGFKGNITLEIANLGTTSVMLYENMRICQLVFEEIDGVPNRVYGEAGNKYQNQKGVTGSLIYWDEDTELFGEE